MLCCAIIIVLKVYKFNRYREVVEVLEGTRSYSEVQVY